MCQITWGKGHEASTLHKELKAIEQIQEQERWPSPEKRMSNGCLGPTVQS